MVRTSTLLEVAKAARARAYVPYSNFAVGAALLTSDGTVISGSNLENASFGLTVCAERVAFWSALHAGYHKFERIAVVADCVPPPTPCGACRQVMWEFARDLEVVMGNLQGDRVQRRLDQLLPDAFSGQTLDRSEQSCCAGTDLWRLPIPFRPVGYVVNEYSTAAQVPDNYRELLSNLVIDPEMEEGLYRLEEEKKIIVIGYLHQARGYALKEERSGRGGEVYGVFACRSPYRPNAISHSVVDLVARKENVLIVRGLDLINGTPVLDIKTVVRSQ